ncbi:alanine--tRNA ligase [Blochmannia endosymbiont of Polyrhachis (Hedomyrma) turneri]|uniref:alanine--tRNA ligase n=1 Tax=Blochmannia endosymbiont of Polyrhachis (Hedomyrma) turneri TaxID=1505596 RepID=UPI00061A638A|nr:alanine--tRNA ligase [Blochmannia endosymbiont of Polyrhachis (Hedomyrma) turneri]AKC59752.1 alanine-tRNA ligase [Blochmannia endosymbiont of Polyrhachis (Hedomyrma) turneri]
MNKNSIVEVRQAFFDFFSNKGHVVIDSSSLLPEEDSSLLFTNAGMNQFKNLFLGLDKPLNSRVVTAQRCVRAGGKHNDLEHVGYSNHHLTFFEMLGNFSFGDYFKETAILFAWELLTGSQWFNLSKDKILVTIHVNDEEVYEIWNNIIGISDKYIVRIGDNKIGDGSIISDNFWQMGDVGPCGYCSEIFYNCGEVIEENQLENEKGIRGNYVEIWNLVFMEFNRQFDGTLLPLPFLSVDTGMGLERITSVLQSVSSSYSIDLFYNLMMGIVGVIGNVDFKDRSFRVITDHIRTCSFLISDGVRPSNSGQGYVLRRIIRRAVRHGKILGIRGMFFYKLVGPLVEVMGYVNVQLVEHKSIIESVLFNEEKQFLFVLEKGLDILNELLSKLNVGDILDGEEIFYLYSTYGFPFQFTKDICLQHNFKVDEIGFNQSMLIHKKNAQRFNKFSIDANKLLLTDHHTIFIGYKDYSCISEILSILKNNQLTESLFQNEFGFIVLDTTPFYGESGGQIGDIGELRTESVYFEVLQTRRYGQIFVHWGKVISGIFRVGDRVTAQVNKDHRRCVSSHHSATHLLHSALVHVLGSHVVQRGSLINNQYLRFDFSHDKSLSLKEIYLLEDIVNNNIRNNLLVCSELLPIDIALNKGAKSIFGKRYDPVVRVLSIGDFSIELCGGTHVDRTGDIGLCVIRSEHGVAYGVRRIEAVCGVEALFFIREKKRLIQCVSDQVRSSQENVVKKVSILCNRVVELETKLKRCRDRQIIDENERLIKQVRCVGKIKLIVDCVDCSVDLKMLRMIVCKLKKQLVSGIVVIMSLSTSKVILHLVVGVTKDLIFYVSAAEIVSYLNNHFGGSGGGRSDLAQSGGGRVKALPTVIDMLDRFLIKKIGFYNM